MKPASLKNLHVPLPEETHARLREEVERTSRPATQLAREAIEQWLDDRRRKLLHASISSYASSAGGTVHDLDPHLEAAALEALLPEPMPARKASKRRKARRRKPQ
jgi:hypothetical protein